MGIFHSPEYGHETPSGEGSPDREELRQLVNEKDTINQRLFKENEKLKKKNEKMEIAVSKAERLWEEYQEMHEKICRDCERLGIEMGEEGRKNTDPERVIRAVRHALARGAPQRFQEFLRDS